MDCYCCSSKPFMKCCEPFLNFESLPLTAEALMRSRYSAFCTLNNLYLNETISSPAKDNAPDNIEQHNWVNLSILSTTDGQATDTTGTVKFEATFEQNGALYKMTEHSVFNKIYGRWFYTDSIKDLCCLDSLSCIY